MRCPLVLSLLSLTPCWMVAADLPVTAVTVLPDGLLVECRGLLPAGDLTISGLPPGCTAEQIALIAADGSEPTWRLVPPPALAMPPEPAAADLAALDAASRNAAIAGKRAELAGLIGTVTAEPTTDAGHLPGLWTPAALNAQLAFAAANTQQATEAAQAAADAAATARARLAELPPAIALSGPHLELSAAPSGPLVLRYRLGGAQWAPIWRVELDAQGAQLVQSAVITLDRSPSAAPVALTVTSFGQQPPLLLPEPSIPLYGLSESMAIEQPTKRRIVSRSGSIGSECAVDMSLRTLKRQQSIDGSWTNGSHTTATTALAIMSFLGAGYDHKTPNRYRKAVQLAMAWLTAQNPHTLDLPALALTTDVLCQAYGMTSDEALKADLDQAVSTLRSRWPNELPAWCARDGALAGPEVAAYVVMALKSAVAAGIDTGDDLRRIQANGPDHEEERLAQAVIAVFSGRQADITLDEANRWAAAGPRWLASGRSELIYFALLSSFQQGGDEWRIVQGGLRSLLIDRAEPDGWWSTPHPFGRLTGSLFCQLSMEIYYRYAQIRQSMAAPAGTAMRWPVRVTASDPVRLSAGEQQVELRRIRLPGAVHRESVPALDPTVWRVLIATNPWPGALPPGPLTIVADGRELGTTAMPETAPGAELRLAVGADERYRIRREATTTTEDHLLSRTLLVNVACTLEAPVGAHDPVTIREALPEPDAEAIDVALIAPLPLAGDAYRTRLKQDPTVTLELQPGATATVWSATFTYSRAVRPRLETR